MGRHWPYERAVSSFDGPIFTIGAGPSPPQSLAAVVETAEWYSLSKDRGAKIVGEIIEVTRRWREVAARAKIAREDIELTATAFAQSDAAHSET